MSHFHKLVLGGSLLLGTLAPQVASANFYVIPVGQSPIPTASVKNFSSACVSRQDGKVALPYTVPEGKAFVVTDIVVSTCSNSAMPVLIEIGPDYKQYAATNSTSSTLPNNVTHIYNYNLGIVLHTGEQISLTNTHLTASSTSTAMISVSGYETRP